MTYGPTKEPHGFDPDTLLPRMQAFGYTVETLQFMLAPLIHEKRDPVGSMGNDSALACLSDQPRMLYDYFKQLFAQVTNPAIDSIREEIIMSLECYIGPELNLLETTEQHANRLLISHPILTNEELAALKHMNHRGWKSKKIDITFARKDGAAGVLAALDRICAETEQAIDDGYSIVVLSDRAMSQETEFRSARCWHPPACTIISSVERSARESESCWKPAKPAKCIITACSSDTVPTRSIRIWRLRLCGKRAAKGVWAKSLKTTTRSSPPIARVLPKACSR